MQHFSNKTLNENWFEDRLKIPQTHELNPDQKVIRPKEQDLNCLTSTGLAKPLGRIDRKPKQETFGLIPDDGFRELKTIKDTEMPNPSVHRAKQKPVKNMINKYNIAELSLVDRPIDSTHSGFGAVINRHGPNHDQRFFDTTNKNFYGEPKKLDALEAEQQFRETQIK